MRHMLVSVMVLLILCIIGVEKQKRLRATKIPTPDPSSAIMVPSQISIGVDIPIVISNGTEKITFSPEETMRIVKFLKSVASPGIDNPTDEFCVMGEGNQ